MPFLVTCKALFEEASIPVKVSNIVNRPLQQAELHRHEFYEMTYIHEGSVTNKLSTEDMSLKAGDLLILKPYVQHVFQVEPNRQVNAYCCSFLPEIVDSNINSLADLRASNSPNKYYFSPFLSLADDDVSAVLITIPEEQRTEMAQLFQNLQKVSLDTKDSTYAKRRSQFLHLLTILADHYSEDTNSHQNAKHIASSRYHKGLRRALIYLHDHISEPLTLNEMASMSGVSISYFSMLFKQSTGMSFLNYLTGLRIDQACLLLKNSTENIMDICYNVGFNDYSHFSKKFKEACGVTPREYRRQNQ